MNQQTAVHLLCALAAGYLVWTIALRPRFSRSAGKGSCGGCSNCAAGQAVEQGRKSAALVKSAMDVFRG